MCKLIDWIMNGYEFLIESFHMEDLDCKLFGESTLHITRSGG